MVDVIPVDIEIEIRELGKRFKRLQEVPHVLPPKKRTRKTLGFVNSFWVA
jgi:hypothetical protein